MSDLKSEYLLSTIVDQCIRENKAEVRLLETQDKWFGVTYREDKSAVVAAIRKLIVPDFTSCRSSAHTS